MKRIVLLLSSTLLALAVAAQLPQFSSMSFDGWSYNHPSTPLSMANIGNGKIVIYVNSQGLALTLRSPQFSCQDIDSIDATVTWYCQYFNSQQFKLSKAALTLVIEDGNGEPLDSVTQAPTTPGKSTHTLHFTLPVPHGLTTAQLRFVSWTGDVVSSGAIKQVVLTAVNGSGGDGTQPGDVDGNGTVSIADVTALIDYLLSGNSDLINTQAADVDGDSNISISDVTALIDKLLSSN